MDEHVLRKHIRSYIRELLADGEGLFEFNTTASVGGSFDTPHAFRKDDDDKKHKEIMSKLDSLGYTRVEKKR